MVKSTDLLTSHPIVQATNKHVKHHHTQYQSLRDATHHDQTPAGLWIPYLNMLIPEVSPVFYPVIQSIFYQYGCKDTIGEYVECLAKSKVKSIHCSLPCSQSHLYHCRKLSIHHACSAPWKATNPQRHNEVFCLYIRTHFSMFSKMIGKIWWKENTNFLWFTVILF